jgi:hypothetical protein
MYIMEELVQGLNTQMLGHGCVAMKCKAILLLLVGACVAPLHGDW